MHKLAFLRGQAFVITEEISGLDAQDVGKRSQLVDCDGAGAILHRGDQRPAAVDGFSELGQINAEMKAAGLQSLW